MAIPRVDQRRNDQKIADSRHNDPETWARTPQASPFANGVERRLTAKHKRYQGQGSQRIDSKTHPKFAERQHGGAKEQNADSP